MTSSAKQFYITLWVLTSLSLAIVHFWGNALTLLKWWQPVALIALFFIPYGIQRQTSISVPYLISCHFVVYLVQIAVLDQAVQRRMLFMSYCLASLVLLHKEVRSFLSYFRLFPKYRGIILIIVFNFLCLSLPLHLPPFHGGIAGWPARYPNPIVYLSGMKFKDSAGTEIWVSNAITSPQNFPYRLYFFIRKDQKKLEEYVKTIFRLYREQYGYLKRGLYSSQKYLGIYSYPGHNPYVELDYESLPPEKVEFISFETEGYDKFSLEKKSHSIDWVYSLREGKWIKEFVVN